MRIAKGFTLIELIIVIILLSIVSALGIGLLSGTDGYAPRVASDQWLSGLRLSQRLALLRQDASNLLTLNITQSSDAWSMSINQGTNELNRFDIDRNRINMHSSNSDFASACDVLPQSTFPMAFYLNGYGNQVNASRTQLSVNQRLCFVGTQSIELCISPSGYAYAGSCQP